MGRAHEGGPWYEPLRDQADIDAAVHWVLHQPGIFLNTAADTTLLPDVLGAADGFDSLAPRAPLSKHLAELELVPLFV